MKLHSMNSRLWIILASALASCSLSACSDDSGKSETESACDTSAKPNETCTCNENTKVWECQTTTECTGEKPNPDCSCKSDGTWDCPPSNTACKDAKPNDSCTCNETTGKWENCETSTNTKCDESAKTDDACTCNEDTGKWENCSDTNTKCDESAKTDDACTCNEETGEWENCATTTKCDESAKTDDACTCNEETGEWENCATTPSKCNEFEKNNDSCTCNEETGEWENCDSECQNDCSEEGEKKCGENNDILQCRQNDAGCLKWGVTETCAKGSHCDAASKTCELAADDPKVFRAGFARTDITPIMSMPLAGYGNTLLRMSLGYLDHLYANCIALTDENGATALLFMLDLISAGANAYVNDARKAISEATGIPIDNIFIQGSHTHSAPDMGQSGQDSIKYYKVRVIEALVEAASQALSDRAPAALKTGDTEIKGLNFVRHYLMNDGTYAGDNFGDTSSGYKGHETEADHTLQILQFERKDKKDILLLNFQTHPHRTGGGRKQDVSSDIVGQIRENVERELNVWSSYLQGASGNINPTSRIASENATTDYKEYGVLFTKGVVDCYKNKMSAIQSGNIRISAQTYTGTINHSEDYKYDVADKISKDWTDDGAINDSNNTNDSNKELVKICDKNYKKDGKISNTELMNVCKIHSPYHANSIRSKKNMDKTSDFNISSLGFGDVGLICAPFELFDVNGDYIKTESTKNGAPFKRTLIMGYCNDGQGYLPADYSYDNTSYEADTCKFEKGTAEKVAKTFVDMLNKYENKPVSFDYKVTIPGKHTANVSKNVYWNTDFSIYHCGTVKNRIETSGKYTANVIAQDGTPVSKTLSSKEVVADFDKYPIISIHEKDGVVTEAGTIEDAGYQLGCDNYWVNYYDSGTVTVNSSPNFNGVEKKFKITSKTRYIMVPKPGTSDVTLTTQFRTNDRVWIVSDKSDNVVTAFITNREFFNDDEEEHYETITSKCKHCNKVVEWTTWYDRNSLPIDSGHYRLIRDGALSTQMSMNENAHICLDLNGHTYLGKENLRMYSLHNPGAVLALMDNSKTGKGGLKAQGTKTRAQGAVVWARYGEAYFYDGIFDGSKIANSYSGTVFDGEKNTKAFIYGGQFIGGKSYYDPDSSSSGGMGATLNIKGECTIHDGTFQGGNATSPVADKNGYGGIVNVASGGQLTIHGGKFSGGKSDHQGGCVSVYGKMSMDGGDISGCDSKTGKILYVGSTGDAKITGGHVDKSKEANIVVEGSGKLDCDKKYCY